MQGVRWDATACTDQSSNLGKQIPFLNQTGIYKKTVEKEDTVKIKGYGTRQPSLMFSMEGLQERPC